MCLYLCECMCEGYLCVCVCVEGGVCVRGVLCLWDDMGSCNVFPVSYV